MERQEKRQKRPWELIAWRDPKNSFRIQLKSESFGRFSTYLGLLFLVFVFTFFAWIVSKWQLEEIRKEQAYDRVLIQSLKRKLLDFESQSALESSKKSERDRNALAKLSYFPGLDRQIADSEAVDVNVKAFEIVKSGGRLKFHFHLKKKINVGKKQDFYWHLLIFGPQGLLVHPSSMQHSGGPMLSYEKANTLRNIRKELLVKSDVRIGDFLSSYPNYKFYGMFLFYDSRGSLLVQKRLSLKSEQGRSS